LTEILTLIKADKHHELMIYGVLLCVSYIKS